MDIVIRASVDSMEFIRVDTDQKKKWTEFEIQTLRESADFLSMVITNLIHQEERQQIPAPIGRVCSRAFGKQCSTRNGNCAS